MPFLTSAESASPFFSPLIWGDTKHFVLNAALPFSASRF
jgi:hypothetical protein